MYYCQCIHYDIKQSIPCIISLLLHPSLAQPSLTSLPLLPYISPNPFLSSSVQRGNVGGLDSICLLYNCRAKHSLICGDQVLDSQWHVNEYDIYTCTVSCYIHVYTCCEGQRKWSSLASSFNFISTHENNCGNAQVLTPKRKRLQTVLENTCMNQNG